MLRTKLFQKLASIALVISVPLSASAATVADVLKVKNDAVVTRGEFIRAAIAVMGVPTKNCTTTKKYTRPVPRALIRYVCAAEKYGATEHLGKDLSLAKGINRGEALIFVTKLRNDKPSGSDLLYTDVKKGSELERAVKINVQKQWMDPVRANFFGVDRSITGAEARLLLRKITGESVEINLEVGPAGEQKVPASAIRQQQQAIPQLPENDLLRAVWQLLNQQYLYNEKINEKDAAYRAAEALVNSLSDPYTTFMRPVDAKNFQEQLGGEVSGIGAQVEYHDNALTVVAPLSGSPAIKAGIKPGDRITAVNGQSLAGSNLAEAIARVRGPRGSSVTLTIERTGTSFEVTITRDIVQLPEIDISYQNEIAIVKIVQFGDTTDRQLRTLMMDVQKQNPKGIVLDLRNNPGGLLHAAEITVSNFLPEGSSVAQIKSKKENFTEVTADPPTIGADVGVVVLINKGSASASEIVAGALQDAKRAKIVGEKSYGKGTVQQIVEFRDGSSLKMTIAEWLTPKGHVINGVGVTPDTEVAATDSRDEQLLRAMDMLR